MSAVQITDHQGNRVSHGRVLVNGVRLHYVTAGSGTPLLLLHGMPKTSFYWYRIIPLLTPHFTIVAPDIRGFGDSAKPHGGYDMKTIAEDLAQLMSALGHDTFSVAGQIGVPPSLTLLPDPIVITAQTCPSVSCFCLDLLSKT